MKIRQTEIITQYKVLGMDMEWTMKDGTPILLKNMKDSHIKNCINMLKRNESSQIRLDWIYVLEDVFMKRRCLKINKIQKNIKNK